MAYTDRVFGGDYNTVADTDGRVGFVILNITHSPCAGSGSVEGRTGGFARSATSVDNRESAWRTLIVYSAATTTASPMSTGELYLDKFTALPSRRPEVSTRRAERCGTLRFGKESLRATASSLAFVTSSP